jgi:hypothetical protein
VAVEAPAPLLGSSLRLALSPAVPRARRAASALLLVFLGVACSGCLIYFSTGPTHVDEGNIVFVVKDDFGHLVAHVHIGIVAVGSSWHTEGRTRSDGVFQCRVQGGVERVQVAVTPPDGFALDANDRWPRTLAVGSGGGEETVRVLVRRLQ